MGNNVTPTISVIMPVYNGEKFLREAIESILNQTYRDFEFIILNDGSTDSTEDIILSYNDSRIVYVKNEVNLQLIKTLNKGIDFAKGKYIARMDADDISLPTRFEEQIKIFSLYKGIDMVYSRARVISEDGKKKHLLKYLANFEAIRFVNVFDNLIVHPAVMIKTKTITKYRYRDEPSAKHIEDLDLWTRMFSDGCIVYSIEKPLLYYRFVHTSINHTCSDIQKQNQQILIKQYIDRFLKQDEQDKDLLSFLVGGNVSMSFSLFKEMKYFIDNYCNKILESKSLSKKCSSDIFYWRNYTLLKRGIYAAKNSNIISAISIFVNLLLSIPILFYFKLLMSKKQ